MKPKLVIWKSRPWQSLETETEIIKEYLRHVEERSRKFTMHIIGGTENKEWVQTYSINIFMS